MKRFTKANGGYSAVNGRMERFNSMKHHYLCLNRGVFPSTETFHSFHWRSQNGISIEDRSQLGSGRECYQWSSYRGYVEDRGFVSRGLVYELIGGAVRFVEFSSSEDSWSDLARVMHSDGVGVLEVARTALGGRDPLVIGASPRPERDACIRILSECGLNASEISRITGVSRRVISRVAGQN